MRMPALHRLIVSSMLMLAASWAAHAQPSEEPKPAPPPSEPAANEPPAATDAGTQQTPQPGIPAEAVPAEKIEPVAEPAAEQVDVWERIRRGFAMPELDNRAAANSTRWYAAQADYIGRMSSRAVPYLFHIVEEVEKRGMPTELALLPFVESAMQPEAESHAKAVGLWQFIPSTGKLYALEQNPWHDQRRGVIESTRAALDYLQKLHDDFGDWHLALAAYNCGESCVGRAVARNRAQKKPVGYAQLRLPRETLGYVPKLQAIKNIVRDPARHGLALPAIENKPYFVAVAKARDIDVATAARLAEMSVDEFRALNPAFNRPVIVGATQPSILLPADREAAFLGNLAAWEATDQPLASWTTYTLAGKESLAQVAERAGVSEAALREANRIPPRYKVAGGSTILIPRDESMEDDIHPQHIRAAFSYVPEHANLKRITYRVRRGDTLASVARRWNVKQDDIVAWNNLRSHGLFAGQRLNLTIASRPPAPKARVAAATKPAAPAAATGAALQSGASIRAQMR
jgi:membrane-bound lytic murein transglycosylase D